MGTRAKLFLAFRISVFGFVVFTGGSSLAADFSTKDYNFPKLSEELGVWLKYSDNLSSTTPYRAVLTSELPTEQIKIVLTQISDLKKNENRKLRSYGDFLFGELFESGLLNPPPGSRFEQNSSTGVWWVPLATMRIELFESLLLDLSQPNTQQAAAASIRERLNSAVHTPKGFFARGSRIGYHCCRLLTRG